MSEKYADLSSWFSFESALPSSVTHDVPDFLWFGYAQCAKELSVMCQLVRRSFLRRTWQALTQFLLKLTVDSDDVDCKLHCRESAQMSIYVHACMAPHAYIPIHVHSRAMTMCHTASLWGQCASSLPQCASWLHECAIGTLDPLRWQG